MYPFSEIVGQRGNILLVCNNNKFSKVNRQLASGEVKWRCIKKTCTSYILTLGDGSARCLSKYNLEHNHEAISSSELQRQEVSGIVKRKAVEDICERPSKILHSVIKNKNEHLKSGDVKCIKKNLYHARRKLLPAIPTSVEEVQKALSKLNPQTTRGEDFLMVNDENGKLIIFCCKTNLTFLCKSKVIYMDGTFQYCAKHFKQMFTIHGFFNGHYIPLVFCLLSDKNSNTYKLCIEKIIEHCLKLDLHFQPSRVVVDFEKAIHIAVETIWPGIELKGCRFHLAQSWWKKIQQIGLAVEYKDSASEVGRWLRYCFGLMFLHESEVSECFIFDLCSIRPNDERLTRFSDYIVDTYISEDSLFPPVVWAESSSALTYTTNACESFHSHFNNSFYSSHPSIFVFLQVLEKIQTETYIKCNSINTPYKYQNSISKKRQNFLEDKLKMYKDRKLSMLDFVKIVSYQYNQSVNL